MEFDAGFDADQALLDVQEQVDIAKRDLPGDSNDPVITEINVGLFPVVVVALYGAVPERTLLAVAQRLKDEFETLPTVLEAGISGDRGRAGGNHRQPQSDGKLQRLAPAGGSEQ